MTSQELKIVIEHDEKTMPVESFITIVEKTLSLLKSVDIENSSDHKARVQWRISGVTMKSPLHMTLKAEPLTSQAARESWDVVAPFVRDIDRLESGKRPICFTGSMEDVAKELVMVYSRGIRRISFETGDLKAIPTQHLIANVDAAASQHIEIGSVEGRLDVINVHRGERVEIWDSRFGIGVKCNVSPLQLEDAKTFLGTKVSIRGRISYKRKRPYTIIDVFDIRQLLDSDHAPQPKDIGPVDLTGDLDIVEYLRGEYDGE